MKDHFNSYNVPVKESTDFNSIMCGVDTLAILKSFDQRKIYNSLTPSIEFTRMHEYTRNKSIDLNL